ncbi:hypothetical protein [Phyllobacterium sp. YR531]|uniref:hypothetical protein n=1 Tax=Phyllobacterium sp. YR531 TaxID=1144343 RepID=UPI00026FBB19|nr:hypothetical protein [Phyllobacterium sp. YR531]EJN03540.1 hypothetical protein PMI41_02535 [Phyllobacterium sp. YR531]
MSSTGNKPLGSDWSAFLPKQLIPAANLLAPQIEVAAAVSVASTEIATRMFGIWTSAMLGSFDLKTGPVQPAAKTDTATDIAALKTVIREKAGAETKAPVFADPAIEATAAGLTGGVASNAADDLKKISGVGPKLAQVLNSLGILSYAQIAGWSAADAAKIDDQLKLNGRISRDDWIGQANRLVSEVK